VSDERPPRERFRAELDRLRERGVRPSRNELAGLQPFWFQAAVDAAERGGDPSLLSWAIYRAELLSLPEPERKARPLVEPAPSTGGLVTQGVRTSPEQHRAWMKALAAQQHDEALAVAEPKRRSGPQPSQGGRRPGSLVEETTFWALWELALDEQATASGLVETTEERRELQFVNWPKANKILKTVAADRERARKLLAENRLPRGFQRTEKGIRFRLR
jgi:hypothetical protein